MRTNNEIAELIFPDVKLKISDLEKKYPNRELQTGAEVTRFAPSPTGFLHTGSLFTALISYKIAKQSNGVFYFRLEDTDQKREIEGTGSDLIKQLAKFNINVEEGYLGDYEKGNYGPYVQSNRADIYKVVIKELIKRGRAYPCFCTKTELDQLRQVQESNKVIPGYYQEYAKCRHLTNDDYYNLIKEGKPYVIRFKSMGNHENHITVHDEIRGDLQLTENDQDIVILKSDGLPTYHFAHLVDDHFMRTTLVTRGEEWIASLPIHVELFETLKWQHPKYAHLPVIMVVDQDTNNKRKLSKRKDPQAAVSFFLQQGYPIYGVIKYLLTIANSNFEAFLLENPKSNIDDFKITFEKFSLDGALFDMPKLDNISKEVLSLLSKDEFTNQILAWSKDYDNELFELINKDIDKFKRIINIEREQDKPRKDYEKFKDVKEKIRFFYPQEYDKLLAKGELPFDSKISQNIIKDVLLDYVNNLDLNKDEQEWFSSMKELGLRHNFSSDRKEYKTSPEKFNGWYADVIAIIRIAISTSIAAPKLYDVLEILGEDEIKRRVNKVIGLLS